MNRDDAVLSGSCSNNNNQPLTIMKGEIETVVTSLNKGEFPGVDNIPTELIQSGDQKWIGVLTAICNLIYKIAK